MALALSCSTLSFAPATAFSRPGNTMNVKMEEDMSFAMIQQALDGERDGMARGPAISDVAGMKQLAKEQKLKKQQRR